MEVGDFIGAVRSPLTKLALRFLTDPDGLFNDWSSTYLSAVLSHFKDSLESLSIEGSSVRLERSSLRFPVPTFTQFHTVRSLTLNQLVGPPHLPTLLELFPHLDGTVYLAGFVYYRDTGFDEFYNAFKRVREENGKAQEQRQWRRIKQLICDAETLFALNLRCPIGLTIIHNCTTEADSVRQQFLVESLSDHPPTHLNLHIVRWYSVEDRSIRGIIPTDAAATLTHLTLCIKYQYDGTSQSTTTLPSSPETRWDDLWRDKFLPALEPLHALTHFRFVFHCDAREARVPLRPIVRDPLVEDLRPTSRSGRFDFTAVASAIADTLPSLQYCFVTNSVWAVETKLICAITLVERWRESRAWRVDHAPTGGGGGGGDIHLPRPAGVAAVVDMANGIRRELVELEDGDAEAIIEREDLILSAQEKASVV